MRSPTRLLLLGVVLVSVAIQTWSLALPAAAWKGSRPAARVVRALTGGHPSRARAALPSDFAATLGYRPVLRAGVLLRPDGSCSSPVPLPVAFEPSCRRHDLGYDLLRYAAAHGRPLGSWARVAVDRQLWRGMHAACGRRPALRCRAAALVAYVAVRANSLRQGDGVPGAETPVTVGTLACLLAGVVALLARALLWATQAGRTRRNRADGGRPSLDLICVAGL
ncbi:MAG TPA: hypothetical protein VF049_16380 [Nocardioidaceae bacterium]